MKRRRAATKNGPSENTHCSRIPVRRGNPERRSLGRRRDARGLLHSGVSDRRGWKAVAESLNTAGCTVVAYDMRGFGDTPPTDAVFSHMDDLIAVLEGLDLETAWIVGSSLGGGVALDAALIASHRMRGFV